jgi:hypothetical protein
MAQDAEPVVELPVPTLMALLSGANVTQAISVAARLNIADLLAEAPRSCAELAALTGTHAPSLNRLMRALASIGIFASEPNDHFALTRTAALLRSDVPNSLRAYAVMTGERWVWGALGDMALSVRTGQPGFERVFGAPLFDYYTAHPQAGAISAAALDSLSVADNAAIVAAYSFPLTGLVIDIGGGKGSLLGAILTANPTTRGLLFERPPVLKMARAVLGGTAIEDRCALLAGDFFHGLPADGDIYLMKKVIHDWNDAAAHAILSRCHAAMPDGARLLLAEMVVPEGDGPSPSKWLDLLMLTYTGGQERTASEYAALLASAGFAIDQVIPTQSNISLIEARKA